MRIISGNKRGKIIKLPKFYTNRPTTDFAKEGLFNILANQYDFENISVLDLFSGTGGISYEFASRGCENITAVDSNKKYVEFIKRQFNQIFPEITYSYIVWDDVFKFILNKPLNFDIIFADPPYELENVENIPDLVFKNNRLDESTVLILEHSKGKNFKEHPSFVKEKKYGNVHFSFFEKG